MQRITKGLDLPIAGAPEQKIQSGPKISRVGLMGVDYVGMKPSMLVQQGDQVKAGQALFSDKKSAGVVYTSPVSGTVSAINRGDQRVFQSIEIEVSGEDSVEFPALARQGLESVSREKVVEVIAQSGLWTGFRTRPFSKIPGTETVPRSIFVTAIDTNPLAVDPVIVIRENERLFEIGIMALGRLTEGPIFVCRRPAVVLPGDDQPRVKKAEFEGPHPAGLPGTHIHFLDPVGAKKTVWHIGYQDVIAIGKLLSTGRYDGHRVISLCGPGVRTPQIVRTFQGASISELTSNGLKSGDNRIISGSVLSGRAIAPRYEYLGRYHLQVSVLPEGHEREFLGWLAPGSKKFSVTRVFASALSAGKKFAFTTSTEGSKRAMVPIGTYEQVMPLDIIPTFLLRSLIVGDTDQAQALGCLELDEEDLALCTFVCPGKYEYGPILRKVLSQIEKDG